MQPKMANSEMITTSKNGRSQYWQQQPKMAPAKIGSNSQKWHQTKLANAAKNG
jgi:hypothetical protein